jgi:hypothetical protein
LCFRITNRILQQEKTMKVIYYNEDNRKILETYKDNIPREMDEV